MPWTKDEDGDLVNLSHYRSIFITEDEQDDFSHAVVAQQDPDRTSGTTVLFRGSEEQCQTYRDNLGVTLKLITGDSYG